MPNVSAVTIDDLIEKAMEEAPKAAALGALSRPTIKIDGNVDKVATYLEKAAETMEQSKTASLDKFKAGQIEKKASLTQIVNTYLELESNK